ncbi:hypothetical protein B0H21DRAFT_699394 [Amylocystis lapponica]|nr:hypothetical protein B0H21DRAFT_699394 [Amylocystis lapponica]
MSSKLSPQARRWRTIIVAVPIMGATSRAFLTRSTVVLYRRLVLGEPQRTLPRDDPTQGEQKLVQVKQVGTSTGGTREEVWGETTPAGRA